MVVGLDVRVALDMFHPKLSESAKETRACRARETPPHRGAKMRRTLSVLLVLVVIAPTIAIAGDRDSLVVAGSTISLGMTPEQVRAATKSVKLREHDAVNWMLLDERGPIGMVYFANGKVCRISRDWHNGGSRDYPLALALTNAITAASDGSGVAALEVAEMPVSPEASGKTVYLTFPNGRQVEVGYTRYKKEHYVKVNEIVGSFPKPVSTSVPVAP